MKEMIDLLKRILWILQVINPINFPKILPFLEHECTETTTKLHKPAAHKLSSQIHVRFQKNRQKSILISIHMMKKMPDNQIIFYQTQDRLIHIEVLFAEENIWLTQKKIAELFDCSVDNVSLHLKNIYQEHEVDQKSTIEEFSVVQKEGKREVSSRTNITYPTLIKWSKN